MRRHRILERGAIRVSPFCCFVLEDSRLLQTISKSG